MQKIELDSETYYENKGKFYNSSFWEVDSVIKNRLLCQILNSADYKNMSQKEIIEFIYKIKETEDFIHCKEICLFALNKFGTDEIFVTKVLPIITSVYRNLKEPEKAIDIAKEQRKKFKCESVALYTSLAGAYCDIEDYETAKKFANSAYKCQGGGVGYKNELSLVYARIQKETKTTKKD